MHRMSTTTDTIRSRRRALGISQQQLAELAQCSIASVRQYENGLRPSSDAAPVYERILDALAEAEKVAA